MRMVQVHIFERKCRFNSCRVHQNDNNPNLTPIGDGFGFVLFYNYTNYNKFKYLQKKYTNFQQCYKYWQIGVF